jgi:hypothetical protein
MALYRAPDVTVRLLLGPIELVYNGGLMRSEELLDRAKPSDASPTPSVEHE